MHPDSCPPNFVDTRRPALMPDRLAALLVFLPSARLAPQQRAVIIGLVDMLQQRLGEAVRILKIDDSSHADVVQSFGISQFPAFVLVRRGVELWRQEGPADAETVTQATCRLLNDGSVLSP